MKAQDIALFEKHGIDTANPGWRDAFYVRFDAPRCIWRVDAIFPPHSVDIIVRMQDGSIYEVLCAIDRAPFDGHAYGETFEAAKQAAIDHLNTVIEQATKLAEAAHAAELVT